ncbi:MAG: hypothetical protein ACREF7_03410 [Candidatus Saccharimonadales bacterium]
MSQLVKVVVTVPEANANTLREAIGNADGGRIGNYTHCSFSVKGVGRFKPEDGAHPAIGEVGRLEEVAEERIEITCEEDKLGNVISAIRKAHPYEEPVIDIYPLLPYN